MRQAILTAASLCMMGALVEQMLEGSGFFRAVRLALGLQIACAALTIMEGVVRALN